MYKISTVDKVVYILRQLSSQPGLLQLKYTVRNIQALLNYSDFQRMKQLTTSLPLASLLDRQPKFPYKYLGHYAAANFTRAARLTAILNHYQFLTSAIGPDFFSIVASEPVVWAEQIGDDLYTVTLSYPRLAGFEGELCLTLMHNSVLVQMVTFVIVPGTIVGVDSEQVLFISQVQGAKDVSLMRHATKVLHDTTPAVVLINAAYGLAMFLGITCAVGISTEQQLGAGAKQHFDYDLFWQQFASEQTTNNLYRLPIPAPEKPIEQVKSNHRARTMRKRLFKQAIRETVAHFFQDNFIENSELVLVTA